MSQAGGLANPENYPNRDRTRLLELFWECSVKFEELHTLYLEALLGFKVLHDRLIEQQDRVIARLQGSEVSTREFQDSCGVLYKELTGCDVTPVSMRPVMKQGDLKERIRPGGRNSALAGELVLVAAYAYWEESLRPDLGVALGILSGSEIDSAGMRSILNKHVAWDLWGDIRHLRTAIVHNRSIATSDFTRCRVLKWFEPGDAIQLDFVRMREIFLNLGRFRNVIHTLSLSHSRGSLLSRS